MKKKTSLVIIIILTVLIASYIGIDFFLRWHKTELRSVEAQSRSDCDQQISALEKSIHDLEEALVHEKNFSLSPEKLNDAFGRDIQPLVSAPGRLSPAECQAITEALAGFFAYLDNNGYSERHQLPDGCNAYFTKIIRLLAKNPPHFTGETSELLNLFQSISHFSRILGKKGILVTKDILIHETDILEPAMALFYQQLLNRDTCPSETPLPALSSLYHYAHFFLNSLSGKSYLMRRSSKIRIITSYYSLVIVRMAEKKSMNVYGLDPRDQAKTLLYDIENHRGLLYKNIYMENLEQIIASRPEAGFETLAPQ